MKRKIIVFFAVLLLLSTVFSADAAAPARLVFRGERQDCGVLLRGGVAYVPIRAFCEANGIQIGWEAKTRSVVVLCGRKLSVFSAGGKTAYINGKTVSVASPCILSGGVFYLPARTLGLLTGEDVRWDAKGRRVVIGRDADASEEDLYWLSRIISAESRGEPLEGKIAVGSVVLNRVKSNSFPDTVFDVIFDRNYGVQFTPTADGSIWLEPTEESVKAAKMCLNGENNVGNCLYFFNPVTASAQGWITKNRVFCRKIGSHEFWY